MRALYQVGEEVMIQSAVNPKYNGQRHVVLSVKFSERSKSVSTGKIYKELWIYRTTTHEIPWNESALRKLPPLGNWSDEDSVFKPKEEETADERSIREFGYPQFHI